MAMGLLSKVVSDKVSGKIEAKTWNEPLVVISDQIMMKATDHTAQSEQKLYYLIKYTKKWTISVVVDQKGGQGESPLNF